MLRQPAGIGAIVFLAAVSVRSLTAQDATQFRDPMAEDFFRYSRMAVGGGAIAKIKTLAFKGKSKITTGTGTIDADVEIKILLPDHYVRIDATPTSQRISGYAGKTLLTAIRDGEAIAYPPDQLKGPILKAERFGMARLLLGATTYVSSEMSMRFQSIGGALEAIDPRVGARGGTNVNAASVDLSHLDPRAVMVLAEDGFSTRWTVDTGHLPVKLTYQGGTDRATMTMTFADRRPTDGVLMPYRIITLNGDKVVDELFFDQILINPEIAKSDFKR
jgi:hypothetical protein